MRYADLKYNDIVDGEGICVSFWTQGCKFHCQNCHNPHTWDFDGGKELPDNIVDMIIEAISRNGINRNFSVLGGEPLCQENINLVNNIITQVRLTYPNIKIYLWTGYTYEELIQMNDSIVNNIFNNIDILIEGRYMDNLRDITLKFRGSSNQRVIDMKKTLNCGKIVLYCD